MEKILAFINLHPFLSAAFSAALLWLLISELRHRSGLPKLSAQQAISLLNRKTACVLDIREADNFKAGHIIGAINTPLKTLEQQITKLKKYQKKMVIVACQNGIHSQKAVSLLSKDFTQVSLLEGGIQSWQQQSLPLVKT